MTDTPLSIVNELRAVMSEAAKGYDALHVAELKYSELAVTADTEEAKALLVASGSVAERQASAKIASADAVLERDIAKAEVSRIKLKLRLLENAQSNLQTQARLLEMEWKHS